MNINPGFEIVEIRGNVETRLAKLEIGSLDAIVLAGAGIQRLGVKRVGVINLPVRIFPPSAGQGIIALQWRECDDFSHNLVQKLRMPESGEILDAERACIKALGADCNSAISAYARLSSNGEMSISGVIFSSDGREKVFAEISGRICPIDLGLRLADLLYEEGAKRLNYFIDDSLSKTQV